MTFQCMAGLSDQIYGRTGAKCWAKFSRSPISPHKSHTSGAADAVAPAAVGVADGELVVGIGVEADIGVHLHAHASAQLQAVGLLQ